MRYIETERNTYPKKLKDSSGLEEKKVEELPDTGVFDRLTGIDGKECATDIVDRIRNHAIDQVVFFGEPAAHKTTNLNQLRKKLEGEYAVRQITFDVVRWEVMQELGKPPNEWTPDNWAFLSWRMLTSIRKQYVETLLDAQDSGKKPLLLVEVMGMGNMLHEKMGQRDRAVSSVRILAAQTVYQNSLSEEEQEKIKKETPHLFAKNRLFIGMVPDPRSQEATRKIRESADLFNDEEIKNLVPYLFDVFNIRIQGLEELSPRLAGIIVRNFIKKSANPEHIQTIKEEVLKEAFSWLRQRFEGPVQRTPRPGLKDPIDDNYQHIVEKLVVPNSAPQQDPDRLFYKLKAGYMEHTIRNLMGLNEDIVHLGITVFSPFMQNGVITWYPQVY